MLAQQSAGFFSVLKRCFSSVPLDKAPDWGASPDAEELAPLLLAGAWLDGAKADQGEISRLAGRPYSGARQSVNRWHTLPDSPVRWSNGVWEFISPIDAWSFLHHALSPPQLDTWETVCTDVLGLDDPGWICRQTSGGRPASTKRCSPTRQNCARA